MEEERAYYKQHMKELEEYAILWAKQIIELGGIPSDTLSDFSGYETPLNNGTFYNEVVANLE